MESNDGLNPSPSSPQQPVLLRLDTAISFHIYNLTQPVIPRSLLRIIEISGDGRLFFPIVLSLLFSPLSSPTIIIFRPLLLNLLFGALLDLLVIGLIKHIVRRPRPLYNRNMFLTFAVDHWSFPSGHSSRVCLIAFFLYLTSDFIEKGLVQFRLCCDSTDQFPSRWINLLFLDEVKATSLVVLFFCSWAAVTSISRILLGRHFVFDVIAGACLGILEALAVFRFFNYENLSSFLSR